MPHPDPLSTFAEDDLIDKLPPIDGEEGDEDDELIVGDDVASDLLEGEDVDDSVAEDLPVGDLVEAVGDDPEGADDEGDLDIGNPAVAFGEGEAGRDDDDVAGAAGDDDTLGIDAIPEEGEGDQDGESVLGGGAEEIDESRLPELDSDDEADLPGEIPVDDTYVGEDAALPPWAAARWERVAIPLIAVPMNALWVGHDRTLAAGEGAVELSFGADSAVVARRLALAGLPPVEIVSVVGDDGSPGVLLATRHGVHASLDGGATVGSAVLRATGEASIAGVVAGAGPSPACYARRTDGRMLASPRIGGLWTSLEGVGVVRAMAGDSDGLVRVVARRDGLVMMTFDGDGRCKSEALPEDMAEVLSDEGAWVAAGRDLCVVGAEDGRLWWRGVGTGWASALLPREACAAVVVDAGARPFVVVAVYVESEDRSYLVRLGADGTARLVGDLTPDVVDPTSSTGDETEGMGKVAAIAWDPHRGWLWVAGRFGLQAWRPELLA
jgi:hypothetical protein